MQNGSVLPCPYSQYGESEELITVNRFCEVFYRTEMYCVVLVAQLCLSLVTPRTVASRLLYPWNSPDKILEWVAMPSSRASSLMQGFNPGCLHCRQILYCLSHQGIVANKHKKCQPQ